MPAPWFAYGYGCSMIFNKSRKIPWIPDEDRSQSLVKPVKRDAPVATIDTQKASAGHECSEESTAPVFFPMG